MHREVLRAFKFALDPTPSQVAALAQHAGAARWAFNYALAEKVAAHVTACRWLSRRRATPWCS
ncbi:helix-turn-helix domain-containing protein [Streptomyces virginiae]|uniref:helix-turn-helix domain-containing protein n=1 Tax=Streptomyces virginiae TaxID=1961 RepID=UPI003631CB46